MSPKEITVFLVEDDDADADRIEHAFAEAHVGNCLIRARDELQARDMMRTHLNQEPARAHVLLVDPETHPTDWPSFIKTLQTDDMLKQAIVFMLADGTRDQTLLPNANIVGYLKKDDAGHDFLQFMRSMGTYIRLVEAPEEARLH
jgi:hypothetical protein